jgi:hypothetical protein
MKLKTTLGRLPSKQTVLDKSFRYHPALAGWFNDWANECGEKPDVLKQWIETHLRAVLQKSSVLYRAEGVQPTT